MQPWELQLQVGNPEWLGQVAELDAIHSTHEDRLRLAIRLALENVQRQTGGSFGAAVFESDPGKLVAAGVNSVLRLNCSVLHAEVVALALAQARLETFTLRGPPKHELVVSCEPCAMCLGAILWSGVTRLIFGA